MAQRVERVGDCTLILGDCRDVLPTLGRVDAVVTDPPYGIDYGGLLRGKGDGQGGADRNGWKSYGCPVWDRERPGREIFDLMRGMSDEQIIWGGNYFTDYLPPTMQWLVWDKGQRDFSLADFEMAWSSRNAAARMIDYPRARALQDGKEHPTQKPVEVMRWCLERVPDARVICDPFMGAGTTGVACVHMRRRFIGVEIDETYFEVALRRVVEAQRQGDLFSVVPPVWFQPDLLAAE